MQEENIKEKTSLVQFRKEKNGYKEPFVTKKSIKEIHEKEWNNENLKEWITTFINSHPTVMKKFRDTVYKKEKNLDFNENRSEIAQYLIDKLKCVPKGTKTAGAYHTLIVCILEFVFFPHICNPEKEYEEHEGRKRIDIVFDNNSDSGFFFDLMSKYSIPANFVMVECKNYSKDVNNPELDQLSGRFSFKRGKFGMLLCRDVNDMNTLLKRCSDTYYDDRGLIIPVVDEDLINILQSIDNNENNSLELLLSRYKKIAFKNFLS